MCKKALSILENTLGINHHSTAMILCNLAMARFQLGHLEGTYELLDWALANSEALGERHPVSNQIFYRMAMNFYQSRQYGKAEEMLRHVLGSCRQLYGTAHSYTITVMTHLALCCKMRGHLTDFGALAREAASLVEETADEALDHGMVEVLEILADVIFQLHDYARAQSLYKRAESILYSRSGAGSWQSASVCTTFANESSSNAESKIYCGPPTSKGEFAINFKSTLPNFIVGVEPGSPAQRTSRDF